MTRFKKEKNRKSERGLFYPIIFCALFFLVVAWLVQANARTYKTRERLTARIESLQEEIRTLESQKKELEEGFGSEASLERAAREQLGLKAQGEEVVVISKESDEQPKQQEEQKTDESPQGFWQWIKEKVRD